MPETAQQLIFKLVIDGKEAQTTLDVTKGAFVETGAAAEQASEKIKSIGGAQGFVQNLGDDFDGVNVTIKDLTERLKELKEKLESTTIGGEAYQRWAREIKAVEDELDKATTKLKITSLANEGLTNEALKYTEVNDLSVKGLSEYITTQGLSIDTIQKTIHALDAEIKTLEINSEAWKQKFTASTNLRAALGSLAQGHAGYNQAVNAGIPGQSAMNMAMMQFGYVLNDAQMFIVNARMGLMGISNNLPMIVQLLTQAKQAAGENASMMQLLTKSIMGGGGLIIGINALMLLINLLPALFGDSTRAGNNLNTKLDDLTAASERASAGFAGIRREIRELSFDELSEKYDALIKSILESDKKLTESSLWSQIWQGLTFKPLTSMLGYTFPWQDAFEGVDGEAAEQKAMQEKAKGEIEAIGAKIKEYLDAGYSAKELLDVSPKQRGEIAAYLDDILNNWAENIDRKNLFIGDKLRGTAFEIGEYGRQQVKGIKKAIDDLNKKETNRFAEQKASAVDKFIQEENRQTEAARLAGLTYEELLNELANAEKDYSLIISKIKEAENEKELEAALKFAEIVQFRIKIVKDYMKDLADEMKDMDEEMKKFDEELNKKIPEDIADEQKFRTEKQKFFRGYDAGAFEIDPYERRKKELEADEKLTIERAELYGASEEQITNIRTYYANQRMQIANEEQEAELSAVIQTVNKIASFYNQLYNSIRDNITAEINEWRDKEQKKLEAERDTALEHARTQQQREKINEDFNNKMAEIEQEALDQSRERLSTWFEINKAISATNAIISSIAAGINTLELLSKYLPPPLPEIAMGLTIAAGLAQAAVISQQELPKGFNEGGILPEGKMGFFEGEKREVVAPEEDFKTYSAELVRQAAVDARNYISVIGSGADAAELRSIKDELKALRDDLKSGLIYGHAIVDDDTAYKIGRKWDYENRTGR